MLILNFVTFLHHFYSRVFKKDRDVVSPSPCSYTKRLPFLHHGDVTPSSLGVGLVHSPFPGFGRGFVGGLFWSVLPVNPYSGGRGTPSNSEGRVSSLAILLVGSSEPVTLTVVVHTFLSSPTERKDLRWILSSRPYLDVYLSRGIFTFVLTICQIYLLRTSILI